jgi:hypothetical protein
LLVYLSAPLLLIHCLYALLSYVPLLRYLCDTPFPFAWAQLIMVMLLFLQFTAPFAVVSAGKGCDWTAIAA